MKRVFSFPPLTAYKRQQNVRDFVVKARIALKESNNKRIIRGIENVENALLALT